MSGCGPVSQRQKVVLVLRTEARLLPTTGNSDDTVPQLVQVRKPRPRLRARGVLTASVLLGEACMYARA